MKYRRRPAHVWYGHVTGVHGRTMWLYLEKDPQPGPCADAQFPRRLLHTADEGMPVMLRYKTRTTVTDMTPPPPTAEQLAEIRRRAREWVARMAPTWLTDADTAD